MTQNKIQKTYPNHTNGAATPLIRQVLTKHTNSMPELARI